MDRPNPPSSGSDQTSVEIKQLAEKPEALDTVSHWLHEEFGRFNPGETVDSRKVEMKRRMGPDRIPLAFVACRGDEVVGTASILPSDMDTRPELTPWLASVYVPPKLRGQGIGSSLCRAVAQKIKELGYPRAYLFTPDREDFYRRLGWRVRERTEYRGQPVTVMESGFLVDPHQH